MSCFDKVIIFKKSRKSNLKMRFFDPNKAALGWKELVLPKRR